MMCFVCWTLLAGILYAFVINVVNHFWPSILARYVWLEVVGGILLTVGLLFGLVGETVHIWQILVAFGLTGGPMAAGSLVRQALADFLTEKTEEGEVSEALDG